MNDKAPICSTLPMRIAKLGTIILSAALCALGIVLMALPGLSARLLGICSGSIFLAFGLVKLVGFFSKDLFRLAFQYDLEFGILMALLGVFTLIHPGSTASVICTGLGVLVLADALFKIRITLDARRFGIRTWWVILAIAAAAAVFGAILMFRPGKGLRLFLGIAFVAEGLMSMSTALAMVKIIRHQIQDES